VTDLLTAMRPGAVPRRVYDPRPRLYPAALKAFDSKARFLGLPWGRGSGKTTTGQEIHAVTAMRYPRCNTLYLADTITRAIEIAWQDFLEIAERAGARANSGTHHVQWPGVAFTLVTGADNIQEFNRKRGPKRIALVHLDECQDWLKAILRYAITRVFIPRLSDLEASHGYKSRLICSGTGGDDDEDSIWRQIAEGELQDFEVIKNVTQWDNPHIADPDGEFEVACRVAKAECQRLETPVPSEHEGRPRHVDTDDPALRREWFAEFNSAGSLVVWRLPQFPAIDLPTSHKLGWRFAWGIDLASTTDNDALVVLGWRDDDGDRRVYVVDEWQAPGTEDYEDMRAVLERKMAQWRPSCAVGDTGGHGATKLLNTFRNRLGVPIYTPKPTDVEGTVRLMNNDLSAGRLRVPAGGLRDDMKQERWKVSPSGVRSLQGGHHSDLTAALRYAWAAQYAFRAEAPPKPKDDREAREWELQKLVDDMAKRRGRGKWRHAG
jgi:hypothetical protein